MTAAAADTTGAGAGDAGEGYRRAPPGRAPTFGLVAPSGYLPDLGVVPRIERYFAARGCLVVVDPTVSGRWTRFSARDQDRVAALHRMARNPDVDVVIAARGGYGLSRLLADLDYALLADSGKIFAGHSDFTALNLALLARAGRASLCGPTAAYDFGGDSVDPFTEAHFWGLLENSEYEVSVAAEHRFDGVFEGTIWGGNLAMVCSLVGTPYLPRVDGGILFLEDVNEAPYRVERMLLQLAHAGIVERQRLVLLGGFSGATPLAQDNGFDLDAAFDAFASRVRTPVLTRLPFGHQRARITVPVGGQACVEVGRDQYRLRFSGYPSLACRP